MKNRVIIGIAGSLVAIAIINGKVLNLLLSFSPRWCGSWYFVFRTLLAHDDPLLLWDYYPYNLCGRKSIYSSLQHQKAHTKSRPARRNYGHS